MGLLFDSAGAHTYPKSGQVAPPPSPLETVLQGMKIPHLWGNFFILRQKLYQKIMKHFMTSLLSHFYVVILYFRLRSSRKSRKLELLCFLSDLLEIWGNLAVLIRKRRLKLKLKNDLSKKLQFSTDFSQN